MSRAKYILSLCEEDSKKKTKWYKDSMAGKKWNKLSKKEKGKVKGSLAALGGSTAALASLPYWARKAREKAREAHGLKDVAKDTASKYGLEI
jgi:hypothetical protein